MARALGLFSWVALAVSHTAMHFDGTRSRAAIAGTERDLRAVWASGADDVWAAGAANVVVRSCRPD